MNISLKFVFVVGRLKIISDDKCGLYLFYYSIA